MKDVLNVWVCDERSLQLRFSNRGGRKGGWVDGKKKEGGKGWMKKERDKERGRYIEL